MKRIFFLLMILGISKASIGQYKPLEQGSTLKFTIKNIGFGVDGTFGGFEGSVNFDPQNPATSSFDVSVSAATVNTDNNLRDEHLKGEGYFDVKNYPRIKLVSTTVTKIKNGTYLFNGQLTIKGTSKPVKFPFTETPDADGFLFNGAFKINRKDFGVGGTSTISDELQVTLSVKVKKG